MEEQDKIPSTKVQRAGRIFTTGLKVGGNYISHYAQKAFKEVDHEALDRKNALEILNTLRQLKGSGLKIAQMLSMDSGGLLPKVYADTFAAAQNNAMALSGPLMINTFRKYSGKTPYEIFDEFNPKSELAASIGQVHVAYKDGRKLAVKIQYPGVAESIKSDLSMVKPLILRAMGVSAAVVDEYINEIEGKLVEETDYENELNNAVFIRELLQPFPNIVIPKYYPEYSSKRILTMEWLEGQMLNDFIENEKDPEKRQVIGQALMDFLAHQIHYARKFHADLHPGNFIITPDMKLGVVDFGCVKELPLDFYNNYFALGKKEVLDDPVKFREVLTNLDFLRETDTPEEEALFIDTTMQVIELIGEPLHNAEFNFGDVEFYNKMLAIGESIVDNKEFRKPSAIRGSKHGIYLHRAFYGLYGILHKLNATVKIDQDFIDKLEY